MKLNLLSKQKFSNWNGTFYSFICVALLLFNNNANAQIVETFTNPTANSLNAVAWSAGTYYPVNQYVYAVDMATVPSVNRLYKVLIAGTSTTMPVSTASADLSLGATYVYMGLVASFSSSWKCPTGITSIQVECWGAGGAGGSASTATAAEKNRSGGGGGAGSYVKKTITVVPGTTYNIIVGQGGYKGSTLSANGYYGNLGGRSEFSGGAIAALVASGGTGGSGAGSGNLNANPGGVLGGVYGFNVTGTGTGYTSSSVVTLTGGGGSGATAVSARSSGSTIYVATTNQGAGYTSAPTVSVSIGTGQTFLAYANPNINSTGAGITTILGSNGSGSSASSGGAGGISPDGLAGGEGGTGSAIGGYVGTSATNVGAGGGGGFSFNGAVGTNASAAGGAGANGKIVITYTATLINNYTYTGSGDLHDVSNWKDGSNKAPVDFTSDFQIFKINSNANTTEAWTVSGTGSKIVVGDEMHTGVSLTIANGYGITGTLDVTNGNKVYVQGVSILTPEVLDTNGVVTTAATYTMDYPIFGTLGDTSEVHYQNSGIYNALVKTAFTYGKLYVDGTGTGTVYFSGATNTTNHIVKTLFEVAENSKALFSEISYYYMTLNSGASAVINGTLKLGKIAGLVSSNVASPSGSFGTLQFLGAEALSLGANSTIEYSRGSSASTQNITPRTDYKNLTLSGLDNNKSFTGATTVSGILTLTITGTSTLAGAANLTLGNGTTIVMTAGSLNAAPTFGATTNVTYDGTTATISSFELPTSGINNLTINNAAGVTLGTNTTVNGAIIFTAGKITTASNTLTIGTSGSITGAGTGTGWVVGNLKKLTASGYSPSFTYALGDATNYRPLALTFSGNTSAAGGLTAKTTSGDHASIAGSGLDSTKSVNRTWTLTNDALADFGTYDAAFTYATADNDAGTTPANYAVRLYNGSTWSILTTSGTTTDAATTTGITGFGDFVIGEHLCVSTTTTGSVTTSICAGDSYTWPANGVTYTMAHTGITYVSGCNTATLNLSITPLTTTGSVTTSICVGDSYTWPANGVTYNTAQTGITYVSVCNTATLNLTIAPTPNAGNNGTLSVCAGTTPGETRLFAQLGGTPDTDGSWSGPTDGVYTYTVAATSPCTIAASATVTVTFEPLPSSPVSNSVTYCQNQTATALTASGITTATTNWYDNLSAISPLQNPPTPSTTTVGTFNYYVSQTGDNGCESDKTLTEVIVYPIYNATICYVSSDETETIRNRIYINNNGNYNVDKYQIFREGDAAGIYDLIGEMDPNQNSFLDLGADNSASSNKYKVKTKDISGLVSNDSSIHKTILLQSSLATNNNVNLSWTTYDGISYGTYTIYRKVNDGVFEFLKSTSASNLSYTDVTANTSENKYSYYVSIAVNPCSTSLSTKWTNRNAAVTTQIRSNYKTILKQGGLGIKDNTIDLNIKVYPNPTSKLLYVSHPEQKNFSVRISDLTGKQMYSGAMTTATPLDIAKYPQGMYLVTVTSKETNQKNSYKILKK